MPKIQQPFLAKENLARSLRDSVQLGAESAVFRRWNLFYLIQVLLSRHLSALCYIIPNPAPPCFKVVSKGNSEPQLEINVPSGRR